MRVLVGCERSGVVRDAFLALGHDAVSCDLVESARSGPHIVGDLLDVMQRGSWDVLIAFPPCTYLARSGARWWAGLDPELRRRAELFALSLWTQRYIKRVCIENPEGRLRAAMGAPSQVVQPWEYGHPYQKKTLLWLRRLPALRPRTALPERNRWVEFVAPGAGRQAIRSETFPGIAAAMAMDWGGLEVKI